MDNRLFSNLHELDYVSEEGRKHVQSRLLWRLYLHTRRHPIGQGRVADLNDKVTIDSILSSWSHIEPIDSQDHISLIQKYSQILPLYAQNSSATLLFSSGGTTGLPKGTWLTFEEMLRNARYHAKGYLLAGIQDTDVVVTLGLPNLLTSEFTVYEALRFTGCTIIPIGSLERMDRIIDLCITLSATVLLVMPSELIPLLNCLEKLGRRLPKIRLIVTGGERMNPGIRKSCTPLLGTGPIAFRSTFQTSDVGTIGYQCSFCLDDEYHIHEELQYIECVNSSEDEHVQELVTTNLDRYLLPVIRTKTGDLIRLIQDPCSCGRTSRKLQLLGRRTRFLKIGGERFDTRVFERMAEIFALSANHWAVRFVFDSLNRDQIIILLDPSFIEDENLKRKLVEYLKSQFIKLNQQLSTGSIGNIEFLPLLPHQVQFSQTGKRIFVTDER